MLSMMFGVCKLFLAFIYSFFILFAILPYLKDTSKNVNTKKNIIVENYKNRDKFKYYCDFVCV